MRESRCNRRIFVVSCFCIIVSIGLAAPSALAQCPVTSATSPSASAQVTSPVLFQWTSDPESTDYHLIVETSTGTLVYDNSPISGLSQSVPLSPGNYRWRVHATTGSCTEVDTPTVSFTVVSCPIVTTISPSASAQVSSSVTFQWTSDPNASLYHLIVENASTAAVVIDDSSISGTSYSTTLSGGSYRWKVHAVGGPCQEINTPSVPFTVSSCPAIAAISPSISAQVGSSVTFRWTSDPNTSQYHLIVENTSTNEIVVDDTSIAGNLYSTTLSPGRYRWRVHAVQGPCQEVDISPITFTVVSCPVITPVSPAESESVSSPVSFAWTSDSNTSLYHLIVEDASTNEVVFDDSSIAGTSFDATLAPGSYRWRVHSNQGPCQEVDTSPVGFTVLACPESPPVLQTPSDGATNVPSPVTFSWSPVENASSYEVWLSTDGAPEVLVGTTTTSSLTTEVPPGMQQWYVVASAEGCGDQPSETFSFSVPSAPPPTITNFEATPSRIRLGTSSRLVWSATGASGVMIEPEGGAGLPANGSIEVSPSSTTVYTMTATGPGGSATAQTNVEVFVAPEVVLTGLPRAVSQVVGSGGETTSYVLTNVGGAPSMVSLTKSNNFFDQSPGNFTIQPGSSQTVTITTHTLDVGVYRGASIPQGDGVPPNLRVPIELLVVEPLSQGTPIVEPIDNRIDVTGSPGTNPTGVAYFRNVGDAVAEGFVVARAPWIIPDPDLVTIEPCGGACGNPDNWVGVTFSIDRSARPDGESSIGSVVGALEFVFQTGSGAKGLGPRDGTTTSTSLVTIVDTSSPPVAPGEIPPLGPNETALFVPGVGHILGSVGLFLSDVTLVNLTNSGTLNDISMYYTPIGTGDISSQSSMVSGLAAAQPISLADVVKNVFENDAQIGSLQFRSKDLSRIGINANILNVSNPAGTFGTTIPVLRSDRSAGVGESFYLAGLRKSATSHTNLFIQETSGGTVTVEAKYFDESGTLLGSRSYAVGPFQLFGDFDSPSNPVLPDGTVTAVLTAQMGSTGRFSAYATPLDRASGDFWSVVDWNRQFGFGGDSPMVIPVAGRVFGANDTFFRTDVAIVNRGAETAVGALRYYPREGGEPIDRTVTLEPNQSAIYDDVISNLFELETGTLGYLVFTPQSGSFGVTSRTFSSEVGSVATFGTGVSTLPLISSLEVGDTRRIGGIEDASLETVNNQSPGTFRSNFALLETSGASVAVRATLHYTFAASNLAAARGSASKDYVLGPNQFALLSNIAREILGPGRDSYGDFSNLQVDFSVIGGDGAVSVFVSSVDNGTGDQILRTE